MFGSKSDGDAHIASETLEGGLASGINGSFAVAGVLVMGMTGQGASLTSVTKRERVREKPWHVMFWIIEGDGM